MNSQTSQRAGSPIVDRSVEHPRSPRKLARTPLGVRIAALALAAVLSLTCVGSQLGLLAHYSGEAAKVVAWVKGEWAAVAAASSPGATHAHEVATAGNVSPNDPEDVK